ncbi:MAG: hypothetical protein IKT77_06525 [Paludibacteraceae bacterium]|nr:hypothetical protein [Paludibacteraceae bacterium]
MAKKASYFWTSYSDLMTSMFFIMLVLFVLAIALLHRHMDEIEKERRATELELKRIKAINESVQKINQKYFIYNKEYNRFVLNNIEVSFRRGSSEMRDIDDYNLSKLKMAGEAMRDFMLQAKSDILTEKVKYLVIIEGQASADGWRGNDSLSYSRALALYKFWKDKVLIDFDNLPCEVIVSGSGEWGEFRLNNLNIDGSVNEANQRFVIHIIPKPIDIGIIENIGCN